MFAWVALLLVAIFACFVVLYMNNCQEKNMGVESQTLRWVKCDEPGCQASSQPREDRVTPSVEKSALENGWRCRFGHRDPEPHGWFCPTHAAGG